MDSALIPSNSSTATNSSFWKTKDGKFGVWITVILGGLALWGLYLILPYLITLATNMLTFALLCLALLAIMYVVFDNDVRTGVFYAYKSLIRFLRRLLINTDPVAIIEVYIDHLRKQFVKLEEKIQELSGARRKLQDKITEQKSEMENELNKARIAKESGKYDKSEVAIHSNQAARCEGTIAKFSKLLDKLTLLNNILNDMRKACKIIITDKENQVRNIKVERETLNIGFSAFKSALSILKGDPDKRYYFDEAIEAIQSDISMKTGIIEQYLNETSEILQGVNLENAAFEEKGMKLLERWQSEGMPSLLTDGSEKLGLNMTPSVDYAVVTANGNSNAYKNILSKVK